MFVENTEFTQYNFDLQALLFERILARDAAFESVSHYNSQLRIDLALKDTYIFFYSQLLNSSEISFERREQLHSVTSVMMEFRKPVIEAYYQSPHPPHLVELVRLVTYMYSTVIPLDIPLVSEIPEERLLIDTWRALLVVPSALFAQMENEREILNEHGEIYSASSIADSQTRQNEPGATFVSNEVRFWN